MIDKTIVGIMKYPGMVGMIGAMKSQMGYIFINTHLNMKIKSLVRSERLAGQSEKSLFHLFV